MQVYVELVQKGSGSTLLGFVKKRKYIRKGQVMKAMNRSQEIIVFTSSLRCSKNFEDINLQEVPEQSQQLQILSKLRSYVQELQMERTKFGGGGTLLECART